MTSSSVGWTRAKSPRQSSEDVDTDTDSVCILYLFSYYLVPSQPHTTGFKYEPQHHQTLAHPQRVQNCSLGGGKGGSSGLAVALDMSLLELLFGLQSGSVESNVQRAGAPHRGGVLRNHHSCKFLAVVSSWLSNVSNCSLSAPLVKWWDRE